MSGTPAYHVLLIGEDPKQTELYSELIRDIAPNVQVDVIGRVESSLDWVENSGYHLIVVDSAEPLPVLEGIRRISPVASVVIISGNATVEQAVAAIRLGAEDYLRKPFNLELFKLAVKRGLDRKAVFGESAGASSYLNLLNSCQLISASLDLPKIFGIVQSYFSRELKSDYSAIYRVSEDGNPLREEDGPRENRKDRAMEEVIDIALHASNPLPKMAQGNELYRFVDRSQLTPGLFVFRFRCSGSEDYFCVCLSPERPQGVDVFENHLKMLKAQIEVTGRNVEQYLGVQSLVYVDDATGLYNTRYLHYVLDREIAHAASSGKSFAVLFMDGDRFKSVNDAYGHLAGTKLLNELGHELKSYVRESDTVFRYGGDEFVAVLSPCDLPTAQSVAERIRRAIEERSFLAREGLNIRITVTIGVALFPEHANSKKGIIDAADKAMYSGKGARRNTVFVADLKSFPANHVEIAKEKRDA